MDTCAPIKLPLNYHAQFHQRWSHLNDLHVRNLAWIIDSPVLLNLSHPHWEQRLAQLAPVSPETIDWLTQLDRQPAALMQFLALHAHTRLGLYAENLLAFYFDWCGELAAHSVQVRAKITLGEFDFLLHTASGYEHWEFACKFYLLVAPESALSHYIGPNLVDNLDAKAQKILHAQLALGQHADAQKYLAQPLNASRALLKGWLFYRDRATPALAEISAQHCRGIWCRVSELSQFDGAQFTILSRLAWLAPAKVTHQQTIGGEQLQAKLQQQFVVDNRPVLVAQLLAQDDYFIEIERIFVVPDNWNLA